MVFSLEKESKLMFPGINVTSNFKMNTSAFLFLFLMLMMMMVVKDALQLSHLYKKEDISFLLGGGSSSGIYVSIVIFISDSSLFGVEDPDLGSLEEQLSLFSITASYPDYSLLQLFIHYIAFLLRIQVGLGYDFSSSLLVEDSIFSELF